jgi:hypothetical protein
VFVPCRPFQLSLMFVSVAGAYPSEAPLGRLLSSPYNALPTSVELKKFLFPREIL